MSEGWSRDAEEIRALRPRHVLFLCVANSARSQMAAAIARALAPGLKFSSAGSRPTALHPLAVEVLADVGIDIRGKPSLHVQEVPSDDVDVVITLCDEDVGAQFPGNAVRIHWPLPDPSAATGSEGDRLEAFRTVCDELMRRLTVTFGGPRGGPAVP
jgi:protein-tyrosine-phosphatase